MASLSCSYCGSDRQFGKACQCCPFGEPSAFELVMAKIDKSEARDPLADDTPLSLARTDALFGLRKGTIRALVTAGRVRAIPWIGGERISIFEIRRLQREGLPEERKPAPKPRRKKTGDPADVSAMVARIRAHRAT